MNLIFTFYQRTIIVKQGRAQWLHSNMVQLTDQISFLLVLLKCLTNLLLCHSTVNWQIKESTSIWSEGVEWFIIILSIPKIYGVSIWLLSGLYFVVASSWAVIFSIMSLHFLPVSIKPVNNGIKYISRSLVIVTDFCLSFLLSGWGWWEWWEWCRSSPPSSCWMEGLGLNKWINSCYLYYEPFVIFGKKKIRFQKSTSIMHPLTKIVIHQAWNKTTKYPKLWTTIIYK